MKIKTKFLNIILMVLLFCFIGAGTVFAEETTPPEPEDAIVIDFDTGIAQIEAGKYYLLPGADDIYRDGYKFDGWYYKQDVAVDVNFIAKWIPADYTISYDLDGGSLPVGYKTSYNIQDTDYTLPEPAKTGYTFTGWTGSNGSTPQTPVVITSGSTGDKSYKANWSVNSYTYDIVYKSSSGKQLGTDTATYNYGTTNTIAPIDIEGYTTPYNKSVAWNSTTAKIIEFVYEPINYTIIYELDGGTLTGQKTSYTIEDEEYALLESTKDGYTFDGWYEAADFSGTAVTSIVSGSTGNKTFYAKWIAQAVSEVWIINETITCDTGYHSYNIPFISNGENYDIFRLSNDGPAGVGLSYLLTATVAPSGIYSSSGWKDEAYRTVEFLEAPTGELLTWLQANAVKQGNIAFSIDGTTYQAETGMTWEDWINSSYNTIGLTYATTPVDSCCVATNDDFDSLMKGKGKALLLSDTMSIDKDGYWDGTEKVYKEDLIIENKEYILVRARPVLISFSFKLLNSVKGTYQAEEGMTFGDWINSSYNTDGYKLDLDNMHPDGGYDVLYPDETLVSDGGFWSTTIIKNNYSYSLGPNKI